MARDKVLTIKVSVEEKERIIKAAGHDKRTYSDWSRLILNAACEESEVRHMNTDSAGADLKGEMAEGEMAEGETAKAA